MLMLLDEIKPGFVAQWVPEDQAIAEFEAFWSEQLRVINYQDQQMLLVVNCNIGLSHGRSAGIPHRFPDYPPKLTGDVSSYQIGALPARWCKYQGITSEEDLMFFISLRDGEPSETFANFIKCFRPHTEPAFGCIENLDLYPTGYITYN